MALAWRIENTGAGAKAGVPATGWPWLAESQRRGYAAWPLAALARGGVCLGMQWLVAAILVTSLIDTDKCLSTVA
jgi:hypothetical protein